MTELIKMPEQGLTNEQYISLEKFKTDHAHYQIAIWVDDEWRLYGWNEGTVREAHEELIADGQTAVILRFVPALTYFLEEE